jgi:putative resolvase
MLFYPYEITTLCEQDGRQLQDGFPLVEVRQARRLPMRHRYRDCTGACIRRSADKRRIYARVSSADQKEDVERQMQRLKDYAAAKGYQVTETVSELASGLHDSRPKFLKLLTDASIGVIVVEHRDRATRFGLIYIERLMQMQGRRLEVIFPSDTDNDLVEDFIAVITSMASRMYGRRTSKRRAEKIKQWVEHAMREEE